MSDSGAASAVTSSKIEQKRTKAKNAPPSGSTIVNFGTVDPFSQNFDDDLGQKAVSQNKIHIRIQQRNGRKTLTTLQGLSPEYDFKLILKAFKKIFACNGTIVEDKEHGKVIQLQGDQRRNIMEFLLDQELAKKSEIEVHGF
ncbi:Eukaryotic translation initiation factor eIF-1 [Spiromyces aspiralis]|uniref:Eukaryotic translation initiation factor eIF-1 n=1 Tax=Spiromyces aspiralis TaxID=68401 RepID=A0ACC1HY13_9FUNG|nr:Eukaryotic translation initiation factor eIF-1 [Spiromyces aspiralis]